MTVGLPDDLPDDLLSPEAIQDPHPLMRRLRERDPVHWSSTHNAWLISRYDDVQAAYVEPRLSCERVQALPDSDPSPRAADARALLELIRGWMVLTDPPAHTRLRRLAAGAFSPKRVVAAETRIRTLVDELLDGFIASEQEDLIAHFAFPLPATVISELMGAPAADRERIKGWSADLALVAFGAGGDLRGDRHRVALRGLGELLAYLDELIAQRRGKPGDDLLSALMQPGMDGDRLSDEELRGMCALLLFAGHETTTSTLASAVLTLSAHPDQMARASADPRRCASAVEEILRFEGPVKVIIRSVSEDFVLRDRRIKAGERVFLLPAAANRDPRRFGDQDSLDVTRSPNPHLTFGRGVHACIGAQLARIEMRVALARILKRLPGLRLAAGFEPRWQPSLASRSLERLDVTHRAPMPNAAPCSG
jgi:cytochrome P450